LGKSIQDDERARAVQVADLAKATGELAATQQSLAQLRTQKTSLDVEVAALDGQRSRLAKEVAQVTNEQVQISAGIKQMIEREVTDGLRALFTAVQEASKSAAAAQQQAQPRAQDGTSSEGRR
jgi:uncharacterized protein (DUF3084 family)